jgi:hypothetical protein
MAVVEKRSIACGADLQDWRRLPNQTHGASDQPFEYAGEQWKAYSSLYYQRARADIARPKAS